MGRIGSQLLKGTTPLLVLSVLRDGELYGYEIAQRIRERSGGAFAPSEGSLSRPSTLLRLRAPFRRRGARETRARAAATTA